MLNKSLKNLLLHGALILRRKLDQTRPCSYNITNVFSEGDLWMEASLLFITHMLGTHIFSRKSLFSVIFVVQTLRCRKLSLGSRYIKFN
jgi:hypothetical protein